MRHAKFSIAMEKTKNYAILLFMSLFIISCESKINFLTSTVVPAAKGYVTVKTDDNENHVINVKLSDLADPSRLTPPKTIYVVWMETDHQNTKNIGQIRTSDLSATLKAVSPIRPKRIFVTAEDAVNVQFPGLTVLTTSSF